MSANDAFTAGVRPGGLTSSTEIRLLLCYLVKNAGPITRQEIENALMEEALVNYFEIGSCLDDITKQALVTLTGDSYTITDKGRKVAQELAYDLPRTVRERAVAAVLRCQTWARKEAKYSARITEKADGHCTVRCTVKGLDSELFCLELGAPDRLSAELVKNAGPITRQEIENALMEEALVNYFEIGSCLDDITKQALVTLTGDSYTITDKGRKVAQELAYDLPRSVRERAVAAVLRCQTWARKEAKYSARITEKADGHCTVRCTVKGLDSELFCLELGAPDRLSAELVKKQFILKGNEIYQLLINKLTEEEK